MSPGSAQPSPVHPDEIRGFVTLILGRVGRERDFNLYAVAGSIAMAVGLFVIAKRFPVVLGRLRSAGYLGTFVAGVLYDYSFTSLPAVSALILIGKSQNVWAAGTIATLGAVVGDLVLFRLLRSAKRLSNVRHHNRYTAWWTAIECRIPRRWHTVVIALLILLFLASPLPNEFADFLMARTRRINTPIMLAISYIGNGIGIYAVVWMARFG
jgi:hypothetical protein